jgi:conjugative transfer region protein TrbK
MRGFPINMGYLGQALGIVAVVVALTATILHLRSHPVSPRNTLGAVLPVQSDALARELAHCQAIGSAARDDAKCESARAENRRRFFTYRPPSNAASASDRVPQPIPKAAER